MVTENGVGTGGVGLGLVEQFVNTLDERTFNRHGSTHQTADALLTAEAWSTWLDAHDLRGAGPGPTDLEMVRALRTGLRAVLLGDSSSAELLAQFPVRLVPDAAGVRLVASTGSDGLDVIIETVVVAVASGQWARLKLCASDDCHWAFYDTSRSGGGRWCSMEVCGNRHKTRTYRRRTAARSPIAR